MPPHLDLDLLRTFVHVVDCGGFTRAGERVHRTQSTISQQIRRLEETVARPLLLRQGRTVELTEEGEALLGIARRMLALQDEAEAVLVRREATEVVRLGIPEDFTGRRLAAVLGTFARAHPRIRLDVRCDLASCLIRDFERGELDVALVKSETELPGAVVHWPEPLRWAGPAHHPLPDRSCLPLALFPQGCLFRRLALERLDRAGIQWRIAFTSPSLRGLQAAVAGGIAFSIFGTMTESADIAWLDARALGLPDLPDIRFALLAQAGGGAVRARLVDTIAEVVESRSRPESLKIDAA